MTDNKKHPTQETLRDRHVDVGAYTVIALMALFAAVHFAGDIKTTKHPCATWGLTIITSLGTVLCGIAAKQNMDDYKKIKKYLDQQNKNENQK